MSEPWLSAARAVLDEDGGTADPPRRPRSRSGRRRGVKWYMEPAIWLGSRAPLRGTGALCRAFDGLGGAGAGYYRILGGEDED